jgi:hypothetical protein
MPMRGSLIATRSFMILGPEPTCVARPSTVAA